MLSGAGQFRETRLLQRLSSGMRNPFLRLWFGLLAVVMKLRRRRVPVICQMNEVECGAACLSMILSYHGRKTRVAELRERFGNGRDGVTALAIAKVARAHGLRVKAYSLPATQLKFVQLPAIAHWGFNHFVVVERYSPRVVEIVDPAVGRLQLAHEEFASTFTGVLLMFEPGQQFQRRRTAARPSWGVYFLKFILQTPGLLAQIVGASLLLQLLGLGMPLFTKLLVDYIFPYHVANILPALGIGMAVLVLAQAATSYLRALMLIYLQTRLDAQMMLGFFEHLLSLPFSYFQQRTSGDLLMRLASNTVIREILTGQTLSIILDGSLVLLYLVIILIQAPSFGLLVLVFGLLQVALLTGTTARMKRLMEKDLKAQADAQSYLVEALTKIETLKASGAEERTLDHWSNLFFEQLNISVQRSRLSASIEACMTALRTFSPLFLLLFGAYGVLNGSMSLGTMLALNTLAYAVLSPLSSLISNGQRLQLVGSYIERIADVLEAEPEQDAQAVQEAPRLSGSIEVRNVSFRYHADAPLVLKNISFSIEPGQKVALVGRTGSGKSSLGKLLLGLYQPTEGEILYDGVPLASMNYRSVRSQFGVVLQEPALFSGSIRQNISLNDAALELDQLVRAAQLAALHDEIMQMPLSYETVVTEGSGGLAGGQSQRLSLARALASNPRLLLLDEATSHLDVLTERVVDDNLSKLSATRILIAHRLSTIFNADMILVLHQGEIVERGSHEELIARGGYYANLIHTQPESALAM
jgi:ATP-binding cassette, subfamily B, bacterial